MTEPTELAAESDAPDAFEELRGEVSLLRVAVEGLTSAREHMPDYTATLGAMSNTLIAVQDGLERIERSPAVCLSPETMAVKIAKASETARAQDARMLDDARDTISRSLGRIDGIVERGQASERQRRRLVMCAVAGLLTGMLLWSILPGAVARALPESWHVPEWMAVRTMGLDEREAGERLMLLSGQRDGE